ncbi:MAG TPA: YihY/virulence factor BrkB family protein [Deltaproteobacteria bacterium]|nr:YihY/virulence factor BrkB family protein [Deltaproteobacteria bacterium]HQI80078.1 YihY/virulence factor BrkB family protein [Deltaproteobacteria bacterium]
MKDPAKTAENLRTFLTLGIWHIRIDDLKGFRRHRILALRVLVLSVRKFISDQCVLWSSALTFYSLMSIVPVAALLFAVAKGFGFKSRLQQQLMEQFGGQQEVLAYVIDFSNRLLDSTRGGILAGAGVIVLLWAVIKMLGNVEESFNAIWGVTRQRSLGRKFSDYLSIMLIAPVLLIASSSAAVMIVGRIGTLSEELGLYGFVAPLLDIVVRAVPFLLIWVLLSFMYIFIPNRTIRYASGILAGAFAGIVFVVAQEVYIAFQIGVSHYNAVYGSFAALPLFLVFLQLGWFIVLFGAELSYAHQNAHVCGIGPEMGPFARRLLTLKIAHTIVSNFVRGLPAPTAASLSGELGMSLPNINGSLAELKAAGIILETHPSDTADDPGHVPARGPESISVATVVEALEGGEAACGFLPETRETQELEGILRDFLRSLEASPANRLLRDIPSGKTT